MTGIYLLAALMMKPEPVRPIENEDEKEFYNSYVHSREGAAQRIRRRAQNLERRIRRLEDSVTSREFDWDQRIRE
jgi:phage shock protein C